MSNNMADSINFELPSLNTLQSEEQMQLLDVVDSLRACGLNDIVALPQLIVCGDQSSGKSSVLEAISGIPFPKQDNLCTRFATEVILRRAPRNDISCSIVPGKKGTPEEQEKLARFKHQLKSNGDFKGLFERARDAMGLSSSGSSFSNDVLRVEFCGPSQPQLTLVDLPGLIHSETKSQTTSDIELVHRLVSQYLENPRSIILAVVSAKNDIGNQIILHRARQVDPQGLRTLGIITKPDLLVTQSKSEASFISLARNDEVKFSLGWHVVKNLDLAIDNHEATARDREEIRFFQDSGFKCLPAHTVGISFLRARLSKVLFNQIRTELPRLFQDIQSHISMSKILQKKLGPSRAHLEEQRLFLIELSQSFQSVCRDAVRGDYDHEFFHVDESPERRLCATVMNMHFNFANDLRSNGAAWDVDRLGSERYRSRDDAIKEACMLLRKSRGRELPGLPNPLLVGELFRQYSLRWGDIARLHICKVWEATNKFFELLLLHLTDEDACENILRFWLLPNMETRLDSAYAKLDELLEVHKDYPMTTNRSFISNSRRSRKTEDSDDSSSETPSPQESRNASNIFSSFGSRNKDMDRVAAEEAFDNMNAYYEVAINLFADNVPALAIQSPIIRQVPQIFCPTTIFSMKADIIKQMAGETDEKVNEREEIERRLEILNKGADICKIHAKRPQASPNTTAVRNISELPRTFQHAPEAKSNSSVNKPRLENAKSNGSGSGLRIEAGSKSKSSSRTSDEDISGKPFSFTDYKPTPSASTATNATFSPFGFSATSNENPSPFSGPSNSGLFGKNGTNEANKHGSSFGALVIATKSTPSVLGSVVSSNSGLFGSTSSGAPSTIALSGSKEGFAGFGSSFGSSPAQSK